MLEYIISSSKGYIDALSYVGGFNYLNVFGMYYILDTSKQERKYTVKPAEEAVTILQIKKSESLRNIRSQYLINVSMDITDY